MDMTSRQAGASAATVLQSAQVTCMLPVKDMARARRFYEEALGLLPLGAKPDGKFVYRSGGTELALFPKPEGTKAEHTAVSFNVDDIAATTFRAPRRWSTSACSARSALPGSAIPKATSCACMRTSADSSAAGRVAASHRAAR